MIAIDHEIRPLTGARAFAAAAIVATHIYPILIYLTPLAKPAVPYLVCGAIAVDFFFILSGFIITHRYLESLGSPSWDRTKHFWVLRFARIWPVHAVVVIAFVVYHRVSLHFLGYGLSADNAGFVNTVANLLMLHQFPGSTPINPPAWSLAPEFGAYLAFPVLVIGLARLRSPRVALAAAAVLLVAAALIVDNLVARDVSGSRVYQVAWSRIAFGFMAGCLLNVGWRCLPRGRRSPHWDVAIVAAVAGILVLAWWEARSGPIALPMEAYPLLGLLVLACGASTGPVAGFLGSPVVEWAGRVSYSVYVTHFLVIALAYSVLVREGLAAHGLPVRMLLGLLVVVAIVVAGAACYYVVEEPARKGLRRLERRRQSRVTERSRGD